MDAASAEKTKQKRVRKAPYRKWSEQEQRQLITFLRANVPIEKPTAQQYYRRFLWENSFKLEWTLVRCKVKNLRHLYKKAKAWTNSSDAGSMQDGETTRDVILRMCPLYDELDEIFGYREYNANACDLDTKNVLQLESIFDEDTPSIDTSAIGSNDTQSDTPADTTELADMQTHSRLAESRKAKLTTEKDIREKELQLKRDKLEFEKEKHASRERFKILKLEMKERIAMKKIESKERIEMEKIKMLNFK